MVGDCVVGAQSPILFGSLYLRYIFSSEKTLRMSGLEVNYANGLFSRNGIMLSI